MRKLKKEHVQKKKKKKKKKKKHEKYTTPGSVGRSPSHVLTGLALLNFNEKTRALSTLYGQTCRSVENRHNFINLTACIEEPGYVLLIMIPLIPLNFCCK